MTGLLRSVREHEGAVEADLQRYYQVDYTDRWRRRDDGTPVLSWRRLRVLLRHLPPDSAWVTALSGQDVPASTDVLLMQVIESLSGQPHPTLAALRKAAKARPTATAVTPRRAQRAADAKARLAAAREAREARQAQQHSDDT